jgi:hypothetical protein
MKKQPPRLLPAIRKQPRPTVPHQRSGPPPPARVHAPQEPSTRAVTYSRTRRSRELRHNTLVERVVLVAAGAAVIGLVYFAWQDGGPRSGVRSSGWYLMANPPAQLPRAGSYVDSRILPNGDVRVEYWVRTRTPMREIELVMPRGEGLGGAPRATDVDVATEQFEVADGKVVGSSTVYPLDHPSRIVRVRYTLVGAVVRSPSAPGRALARFTSADLVSMPEEDGPRMVRIRAPEVLNVACRAPSQQAAPTPCGSQVGTSWQVELHGADRADEVSAQVNLKTP